jgi:Mrp family chromosome partitioning ATPase
VVSDAAVLGALADAVVLVVRAAVTPVDALEYAAAELRTARAPVAGTVLNDLVLSRDASYDGGYRWYEYASSYYATAASGG